MVNDLSSYHRKRDPGSTPEPFSAARSTGGSVFVIHKHAARQLHYDLRLEVDGSLWSWAVPRGPSTDPEDKRLAVHVEPHPVDYAFWEGTIPEGNYGAGAMIIWDRGQWVPLEDPVEGLKKGKLLFELRGFKLFGTWTLVQTRRAEGKDWLLIKERDGWVGRIPPPPAQSVLSGLLVEQLKSGDNPAETLCDDLLAAGFQATHSRLPKCRHMLCETAEPFSDADWVYEIKYDGYRVLARKENNQVALISRNGHDLSSNFPELTECLAALPYDRLILDGEIACLGGDGLPSFQRLQQRAQLKRTNDVQRATLSLPASLFVFDALIIESFDLRGAALTDRKQWLRQVLPPVGPLRYVDHIQEHGEQAWEQAIAMRLEGLVAKRAESPYQGKRSSQWLKLVALRTDDFVVVGYLPAANGRQDDFKSLLLAQYAADGSLHYLGRGGSGLGVKERAALCQQFAALVSSTCTATAVEDIPANRVWLRPELVVEARYKNITQAGNLRQPVLLRIRTDKPAVECQLVDREHRLSTPVDVEPSPTRPRVILSNRDKVFWPASETLKKPVTKGELLKHYEDIAEWMLPWLKDRPVVLTRYPDGIDGKMFFQHQAPDFLPSWIRTEAIQKSDHDLIDYIVIDDLESLLYIINLGTIPLHFWSASCGQLTHPDYCILDLDPKTAPMKAVAQIARELHRICEQIGLPNGIKTSGGSGLHLLIPLNGALDHDQATALAELLARVAVQRLPQIATIQRSIELRQGRVYVDYLQNGFGKTIAGTFCARPHPGAPVSMPLRWHEVTGGLDPNRFHVRNAARRMRAINTDCCAVALGPAPDLSKALAELATLLQ